jgi:hypothetical protein
VKKLSIGGKKLSEKPWGKPTAHQSYKIVHPDIHSRHNSKFPLKKKTPFSLARWRYGG